MNTRLLAIVVAIALMSPTTAAFAQGGGGPAAQPVAAPAPEASTEGIFDELEGQVIIQAQGATNLDRASKFLEYRDEPIGPVAPLIEFATKHHEDDDWYFNLKVVDAAQKDARYGWEFGRYGKFRVEFEWDRIIHNYSFNGETPYTNVGSNHLALSDSWQSTMQAAGSPLTSAAAAATLRNLWGGAQDLDDDLFYQRDRLHFRTEWTIWNPVTFFTEFRYENRDGQKPEYGLVPLGSGNAPRAAVELPVPIDADIWEVEFGVRYAEGAFDATVKYEYSNFNNANKKLTWDSPFRLTDTAVTAATAAPGVYAKTLDPDNEMHEVALQLGYNIDFWRTRISGEAMAAWELASSDLEPYTTNSLITMPAALTPAFGSGSLALESNLPDGGHYDAEVNVQSYNFVMTSHPMDEVDVRGTFRFRRQNNDSQQPNFAVDTSLSNGDAGSTDFLATTGKFLPLPHLEHDRWTGAMDFGYRLDMLKTRFFAGYEYNEWDREGHAGGTAILGQNLDVEQTWEHTARGGFETRWMKDLSTKISYSQGMRSHTDLGRGYDRLPFGVTQFERFNWSDRTRYQPRFDVKWDVMEGLALSGQYLFLLDDFQPHFGLKENRRHEGELDIEWNPSESFMLSPGFGYAHNRQFQRVTSPRDQLAANFNFDTSPFTYDEVGDTYSVRLHTRYNVVKDRLALLMDYTFQANKADIEIESNVGASAAVDATFFIPADINNAEHSERNTFTMRWQWTPSKVFTAEIGYLYDEFDLDAWKDDGLSPVPINIAPNAATSVGILSMDQGFEDAEVHQFWLSGSYKF